MVDVSLIIIMTRTKTTSYLAANVTEDLGQEIDVINFAPYNNLTATIAITEGVVASTSRNLFH